MNNLEILTWSPIKYKILEITGGKFLIKFYLRFSVSQLYLIYVFFILERKIVTGKIFYHAKNSKILSKLNSFKNL